MGGTEVVKVGEGLNTGAVAEIRGVSVSAGVGVEGSSDGLDDVGVDRVGVDDRSGWWFC